VVRRLLALTLVLVALSGCQITLQRFDPMTAEQVEKTISFEEKNFTMTSEALISLGAPYSVVKSLELRHDSEIARLRAWLLAELAKKVDE
jgi:hypothetical protein